MQTLLIDFYDSYTYNTYNILYEITGKKPIVLQYDEVSLAKLQQYHFDNVVIASGANHLEEKYIQPLQDLFNHFNIPILGISFGHQIIASLFDAKIIKAKRTMHGLTSCIFHNDNLLFENIPKGFTAVRYHSFIVDQNLPKCLEAIAWTEEKEMMALRHKERPIWGVQFHPESIATKYGHLLLTNFIKLASRWCRKNKYHSQYIYSNKKGLKFNDERTDYIVHVEKLFQWYDPENVFTQLYGDKNVSFWLDSSRVDEGLSRFSFMGDTSGPYSETIRYDMEKNQIIQKTKTKTNLVYEDIFMFLDKALQKRFVKTETPFDFNTGYVGYFGYELKSKNNQHTAKTPDAYFIFADRMIVFDHLEKTTYLLEFTKRNNKRSNWFMKMKKALENLLPLPTIKNKKRCKDRLSFSLSRNKEQYIEDIKVIKEKIKNGKVHEITLTNELTIDLDIDALEVYRLLRENNPAPYSAYIRFGDLTLLSTSPERFVKIDRFRNVNAKPIKGTIQRSEDEEKDRKLLYELKTSQKDRAENLIIVDVLRHELNKISKLSTVKVEKLMDVESYETVHQLVSTITSILDENVSPIEAIRTLFPGGSMTGAPKLKSMEMLEELENRPRGIYSGAVGFLGLNGTVDLSVVIRSIVKNKNKLSIGVGGAITFLSEEEAEYEEMLLKANALIATIQTYVSLKK